MKVKIEKTERLFEPITITTVIESKEDLAGVVRLAGNMSSLDVRKHFEVSQCHDDTVEPYDEDQAIKAACLWLERIYFDIVDHVGYRTDLE